MCISNDSFDPLAFPWTEADPQVGNEYEVLRIVTGYNRCNIPLPCYQIRGFKKWYYNQRCFAILPDQPAEELEQLEEKLEPELVEA